VSRELNMARVGGANTCIEIGGCADEATAELPRLPTWGDDELASPPMADEGEDGWAVSDSDRGNNVT
jgi:hypothetical protein